MSFNIEKVQELLTNTGGNKTSSRKQKDSMKCIWDADGDHKFSLEDLKEYINENYGNLDDNQKNQVIKSLEKELSKDIQYSKTNMDSLSKKIVAAVRKISASPSSGVNEADDFLADYIKNRQKNTKRILKLAESKGYNSNLKIENSQIKNQYYTGGSFSIEYSGLKAKITNHTNGTTHNLDLYMLLQHMNDDEIVDFLLYIQKQPGEILEDLSIEMDDLLSPTGRDMHTTDNQEFVAGGYYDPRDDSIVTSPVHLIHELGHAVDYSGKINKASTAQSKKFMDTFTRERDKYKAMGNVVYDYEDKNTWKRGEEYNYCTANGQELFAEAYTLAMTGDCRSKNVIMKYFPETFAVAMEIINETRQKSDLERRYTPQKEMAAYVVNSLDNYNKKEYLG